MLPIFKNFQSTSFFKAFVLNAIVAALIATLTIELRLNLNKEESNSYNFAKRLFNREKLSEIHKILVVFGVSFLVSFFTYHLMMFFFAYGSGMIANKVFRNLEFVQYFDDLI